MTTEKDNLKDDLKDLINRKCEKGDTFADAWDLYQHLDYDGSVHELIDSYIDIYYTDLRKWAVDNYHYVEQAMDEGLCNGLKAHKTIECGDYIQYKLEGVPDFHQLIKSGQYLYYNELAYECIEELFTEYDEDAE